MKKKRFCLGKRIGVFLLMVSFLSLPINSSLSLAAETPIAGPNAERGDEGSGGDSKPGSAETPVSGPSTERDNGGRGGDAGPGATKGMKSKKWWWIGGGIVAIAAVIAAASGGGGGGGGGGGSTPSH